MNFEPNELPNTVYDYFEFPPSIINSCPFNTIVAKQLSISEENKLTYWILVLQLFLSDIWFDFESIICKSTLAIMIMH
jgi:hypothetical protein